MSTLDIRANDGARRSNDRGINARRFAGTVIGTLAAFTPLAVAFAPSASARPAPIASTADTVLPAGCPDGAAALVDVAFDNGRGGRTNDLRTLDVRHGDTVTMSWAGGAAGCVDSNGALAISVSLAPYGSPTRLFDPGIDEVLLPGWDTCGGNAGPCETVGGRSVLRVSLPTTATACNLQLDAVLGLPLRIVGPSGDFYSAVMRGDGRNLLVSAANFGVTPCEVPQIPTTTAPSPTPTTSTPTTPQDTPPSTAPGSTTPTTAAPATTLPTAPPADAPAPTSTTAPTPTTVASGGAPLPSALPTTTETALQPAARQVAVLGAQVTQLPRTGTSTMPLVRAGLLAAGAGLTVAGATASWRRRHPA